MLLMQGFRHATGAKSDPQDELVKYTNDTEGINNQGC